MLRRHLLRQLACHVLFIRAVWGSLIDAGSGSTRAIHCRTMEHTAPCVCMCGPRTSHAFLLAPSATPGRGANHGVGDSSLPQPGCRFHSYQGSQNEKLLVQHTQPLSAAYPHWLSVRRFLSQSVYPCSQRKTLCVQHSAVKRLTQANSVDTCAVTGKHAGVGSRGNAITQDPETQDSETQHCCRMSHTHREPQ